MSSMKDTLIYWRNKNMSSMKDILIYSPDRYIVGETYGLQRRINEDPYKTETINGILESYSETELTFITLKGEITVSTQNFDDFDKWHPYYSTSDKDKHYTMYGLSVNESIIDSNFVVDDLYIIKDKWYGEDRTWYGVYLGHELNTWGWPNLKFRNVGGWKNPSFKCNEVFETEVDISKIIRKEAAIYSIEGIRVEGIREIKIF